MTNILDSVASSQARSMRSQFEPATSRDILALALARRLNDAQATDYYAKRCQQFGTEHLLQAYRRAIQSKSESPLFRVFHDTLKTMRPTQASSGQSNLMAIRIERRAVAIAFMRGEDSEWMRVRQLSSIPEKALTSAAFFVSKTLAMFPVTSVAMEIIPNGHEFHRSQLSQMIKSLLRERDVSIAEVHKRKVFESFGYPPKKSRKAVRACIARIFAFERFPGYGGVYLQDALALGLHVQTERLFS